MALWRFNAKIRKSFSYRSGLSWQWHWGKTFKYKISVSSVWLIALKNLFDFLNGIIYMWSVWNKSVVLMPDGTQARVTTATVLIGYIKLVGMYRWELMRVGWHLRQQLCPWVLEGEKRKEKAAAEESWQQRRSLWYSIARLLLIGWLLWAWFKTRPPIGWLFSPSGSTGATSASWIEGLEEGRGLAETAVGGWPCCGSLEWSPPLWQDTTIWYHISTSHWQHHKSLATSPQITNITSSPQLLVTKLWTGPGHLP